MTGRIFDIKQGAVHDGKGLRTTVFLKGCPLRCVWCHNPEGLEREKEIMFKENLCVHCETCKKGCNHEECKPFDRCVYACPNGALSVSGKDYTPKELCDILAKDKVFFDMSQGGVTFSGGEPLFQAEFLYECLCILKNMGIHTTIETSGYAKKEVFSKVLTVVDFVYMDLKIMDNDTHKKYTGISNEIILENASYLKNSGVMHTFRTPLIPDITDTSENLKAIESFVGSSSWEKLKYNQMADVKYKMVGREFLYGKETVKA